MRLRRGGPHGTTYPHGRHGPHDARRVDRPGRRGVPGGRTRVRGSAGARLYRHRARRAGQGDTRPRVAPRGRPRDHAPPDRRRLAVPVEQALPELASVPWRQRTDASWLRRWGRIWHGWTVLYTVPFVVAGAGKRPRAPAAAAGRPTGLAPRR